MFFYFFTGNRIFGKRGKRKEERGKRKEERKKREEGRSWVVLFKPDRFSKPVRLGLLTLEGFETLRGVLDGKSWIQI